MEISIVVILLVLAVAFAVGLSQGKRKAEVVETNHSTVSRIVNFTPSISYAGSGTGAGIAIDANLHKFAILKGNQAPSIYHFSDLIAVEIFRNENSITKTNRGSQAAGAVLGGALLGPAGLLLGGLSGSKRNETKITKLSLKVYTNDLMSPVSEIVFMDFTGLQGLSPEDLALQGPMENLDAWHGRLKTILAMQGSIPAKPTDFAQEGKVRSLLDTDFKMRAID